MASSLLSAGDITAIVGDNSAEGQHRGGYNGVWSLRHRTCSESLFVPAYAGINLEHIFDGDKRDLDGSRKIFFEPRNAPMTLKVLSDHEVELHQPPTPTFHLQSWTRFKAVAPHYLDFSFRCVATRHVFAHDYIGLFWASYIHAPEDKSIYFLQKGQWQQFCTQAHNDESTVLHKDDHFEPTINAAIGDCLFRNYSRLRFDEPYYYGLFGNHVAIFMFDRTAGIRFSHSPSGGGSHQERKTANPAWDFQFVVPKYDVNQEYEFRGRLAFRERCSRDQILQEFGQWRASLGR